MAYNVRIMEKAEEDLSEIVTYISDTLCNRQAAESLLEEFLAAKTGIEDNPYMYPLSNDLVLQEEAASKPSVPKTAAEIPDDIQNAMKQFFSLELTASSGCPRIPQN